MGERASYTFAFKFSPTVSTTAVLEVGQKVWIRFDAYHYDYYLGAGYQRLAGDIDSELHPKYYIDCLVSIDAGAYIAGANCRVKRNTVIVDLGTQVSSGQAISITLVGIRNPNEATPAFKILAMDKGGKLEEGETFQDEEDTALFLWKVSGALTTAATPALTLYRVTTDEGQKNRALAGSDDLNFYFGVSNDDTDKATIDMASAAATGSKFFVFFPSDYQNLPVADVLGGATSSEYDCSLFEKAAASGDLADGTTAAQEVKCSWNYEIDPRGNALQFGPVDQTFRNDDGTNYFEYVLTVKGAPNPFDA